MAGSDKIKCREDSRERHDVLFYFMVSTLLGKKSGLFEKGPY